VRGGARRRICRVRSMQLRPARTLFASASA
jgi:hypothetical protein